MVEINGLFVYISVPEICFFVVFIVLKKCRGTGNTSPVCNQPDSIGRWHRKPFFSAASLHIKVTEAGGCHGSVALFST